MAIAPFTRHGASFLLLAALTLFSGPANAAAAESEAKTLVVLGDSLAAGYDLASSEAFPAQLEMRLRTAGHRVAVINASVSGDTSGAGLARLDWAVPAGTDGVIVELGGNDALRGLPLEQTRANLERILSALKARGIRVFLIGMEAPRNLGADYVTGFREVYRRLADAHAVPLYPFFLEGVALQPSLLLADGIHPNAKGVLRMVEGVAPHIETWLAGFAR